MEDFSKEFFQLQRQQEMQQQGTDPLMQGFPSQALGVSQPSQKASFLDIMKQQPQVMTQGALGEQLGKLGIQPGSISFNSAGRQQLEKQLSISFGPDFAKNPAALSMLQAFDSFMQTDAGKLGDVKLKNNTKTILDALRNYGQST